MNANLQSSLFSNYTTQNNQMLGDNNQNAVVQYNASTSDADQSIFTQQREKEEKVMIGRKSSSVSDLQSVLKSKKRDLEFNQKMLREYPNNSSYGDKIDKLNKEIKELEEQIAKMS